MSFDVRGWVPSGPEARRRRRRWLPAAVLGAVLGAALTVPSAASAAAAPAAAAPATPTTAAPRDAFTSLQTCLAGGRPLDALVLVDASASLKRTDPRDRRVAAMRAVVRGLAALAAPPTARRVDLAFLSFGQRVDVVLDWATLDGAGTERALAAASTFSARNRDVDTDYYEALLAARESLADHARAVGGSPCQAVLWVTDGEYDISDRRTDRTPKSYATDVQLGRPGSGARVVAVGMERLCAPDGVVDGMRADDVHLLTVALSTQLSDAAHRRLLGISDPTAAGGISCGRPAGAPGVVVFADDADAIVVAVDRITTLLGGARALPPVVDAPGCAAEPCTTASATFPLRPSLRGAHLLVRTGASDATVVVRLPGGGRAVLRRGGPATVDAAGTAVSQQWLAPDVVAIDVATPAGITDDEMGSVVLLAPASARGAVQAYEVPVPTTTPTTSPTTTPPTTAPTTTPPTTTAAPAPTTAAAPPTTTPAPAARATAKRGPATTTLALLGGGLALLAVIAAAVIIIRRRRQARAARALPNVDDVRCARIPVRVRYGLTPDVVRLDAEGRAVPFRVTAAVVTDALPAVVDDEVRIAPFTVHREGERSVVRAERLLVVSGENRGGTLDAHGSQAYLPLALAGSWAFATEARRMAAMASPLDGLDDNRTVDLSHFRGLADPSLDGELVVFLNARSDPGQVEQSVRHLLPTLAQAIVAASS